MMSRTLVSIILSDYIYARWKTLPLPPEWNLYSATMSADNGAVPGRSEWGSSEWVAVSCFILSSVLLALATPSAVQSLSLLSEPKPGDGAIGAVFLAFGLVVGGAPMLIVSVPLALFARRLPTAFRIVSVSPGAAAILAGIWVWMMLPSHAR